MSTLWTPDGEHLVEPGHAPQEDMPPGGEHPVGTEAPLPDDHAGADMSPEEMDRAEAMAREMAAVQEQLANTPAEAIVSTHLVGLYELGAIHLQQEPPNLPQAALAIDALGAVVDRLQGRLGENEETLRGALNQIRLTYVSVQQTAGAPDDDTEDSADSGT